MIRPFPYARFICFAAALYAPAMGAGQDLAGNDAIIKLRASTLTLEESNTNVTAEIVHLETPEILVDAEAMVLNLSTGDLELLHPRIFLLDSSFIIESTQMTMSTRSHRMQLEKPKLTPKTASFLHIQGHFATCIDSVCTLNMATGSGCPHQPKGYTIRSRRIVVHESGDIDLSRPVLDLHKQPILALPWIRIRPSGKPGFTFPRLGYDPEGGYILGPSGVIPIQKKLALSGHAAIRTHQGFETRSKLHSPNLDLQVDQLFVHPQNHMRFKVTASLPLHTVNIALDADLITRDRTVLDGMADTPINRVTTHTSSRALISRNTEFFIFETAATMLQPFDTHGNWTQSALTPVVVVTVDLPSLPVVRFFWPSLGLQLKRQGLAVYGYPLDSTLGPAQGHTRLVASPGIDTVFHMGPLRTFLGVSTRHQLWMLDENAGPQPANHSVLVHTTVSLPLFRDFTAIRHIIEPYVTYNLVPWLSCRGPNFVIDSFDALRKGQNIELGLSTSLASKKTSASLRIDIYERIELPGLGQPNGPQYTAIRGHMGPSYLHLSLDGAWDYRYDLPSVLGGALSHYRGKARVLQFGARWLGPGNGPHREPPLNGGTALWLQTPFVTEPSNQVEAFGETRMPLSPRATLFMGARAALWPKPVLHMGWYGLEIRTFCDCLSLAVMGSHRPSTPVPDIVTSFTIRGF